MKIAFKITTFIFFLIALVPAMAQTDKMVEAAELENFKRLEKVCLNALEDRELKRNLIFQCCYFCDWMH